MGQEGVSLVSKTLTVGPVAGVEIGMSYSGPTYHEGKKIGWRDELATFSHGCP